MRILGIALVLCLFFSCVSTPVREEQDVALSLVGHYQTGLFDEGGAEIVAFDAVNRRIAFVNANLGGITILDAADLGNLVKIKDVTFQSGEVNSVAMSGEYIAAAVNSDDYPSPGMVVVMDFDGNVVKEIPAGILPDNVMFTKNGDYILSACEGEPNDDYSIDPVGSVVIVDVRNDFETVIAEFDDVPVFGDVRFTGPEGTTLPQDIEPEYIALDSKGQYAYVSCQENNAIAKVDIAAGKIIGLYGLGTIDHSQPGKGIDAGKDGQALVEPWPVFGMFMPDTVVTFEVNGKTYILGANEGDDREYGDYEDAVKAGKVDFDETAFSAEDLEKLKNSNIRLDGVGGDTDGDGLIDLARSFGTRSFTIWDEDLQMVWNSDDQIEQYIVEHHPQFIGVSDDNLAMEDRTEKKGPEPEAAAAGVVNGRTYAFIGLERDSGIVVYDVTDPTAPVFKTYLNMRNFEASVDEEGEYTDTSFENTGFLSPEGMKFVPAADSPSGKALLLVGFEVSGSLAVFEIDA